MLATSLRAKYGAALPPRRSWRWCSIYSNRYDSQMPSGSADGQPRIRGYWAGARKSRMSGSSARIVAAVAVSMPGIETATRGDGRDPDPRPAARQWLAWPANYRITTVPRVIHASGSSVACGTGKTRHSQCIENKAEKWRRLDAGCFPSASRTVREILSASSSARKTRYIKGTCRIGWVPPPPHEAHLPSLFGRFLRRLGTAPI